MFIPAFVQQQASWLLRAARPLALVLLAVVFAHAHPRIPATRYRCRRADTCGHTASLCCTFENRRGHGHDRPLRSARLSPAAIGTVAPGGPKFGPSFSVRRVTVPKTHFLYAVVQYTQVRTSTAVSSQSTSGEPRNLAASPQPSGRGSIQVPWRLLLRQAYAAPLSPEGRRGRALNLSGC